MLFLTIESPWEAQSGRWSYTGRHSRPVQWPGGRYYTPRSSARPRPRCTGQSQVGGVEDGAQGGKQGGVEIDPPGSPGRAEEGLFFVAILGFVQPSQPRRLHENITKLSCGIQIKRRFL